MKKYFDLKEMYRGIYVNTLKKCHEMEKLVFTFEDTEFYGSSLYGYAKDSDIILSFDDFHLKKNLILTNIGVKLEKESNGKVIYLPTEDGGIQQIDKNKWIEIINILLLNKKVAITCMAGHGRTGTALAIIYGLLIDKDAKNFIRKNYCNFAIETRTQKRYIEHVIQG